MLDNRKRFESSKSVLSHTYSNYALKKVTSQSLVGIFNEEVFSFKMARASICCISGVEACSAAPIGHK